MLSRTVVSTNDFPATQENAYWVNHITISTRKTTVTLAIFLKKILNQTYSYTNLQPITKNSMLEILWNEDGPPGVDGTDFLITINDVQLIFRNSKVFQLRNRWELQEKWIYVHPLNIIESMLNSMLLPNSTGTNPKS